MEFNKFKNKKKLTAAQVYGELPIWKIMVRVALPSFLTSFMSAIFTFIDMLLLVNLMPLTSHFDFTHLFILKDDPFESITKNLNDTQLKSIIEKNGSNYENFVHYLADTNGLHFYDTASIVRIASSLISPLSFLITAMSGFLLPGANVLFSKAISTKDYLKQIKVWQNEFYSSLIVTFIGMLILYILNYTLIESMVGSSMAGTNITITDIHNKTNGIFYYYINNNHLYFLLKKDTNSYIVYNGSEVFHSAATFKINAASLAPVFSAYYLDVQNYAITWAQHFVAIMTAGLWISCIYRININVIRSYGRTLIITITVVLITIFNIILDYLFIFYAQIGMDGAATATIISWSIALVPLINYFHVLRGQGLIRVSYMHLLFSRIVFDRSIIVTIILISSSYMISIFSYMVVRVLLINQIAYVTGELYPALGNLYFISITGAIYPIMNLFQNTISGFTNAGTSIVSYNYGIKRYDRLKIIALEVNLLIIGIGGTVLGLFGFCDPISNWALGLFNIHYAIGENASAYLFECARKFLWISLMILPFQGLGNTTFMLFRSTKRFIAAATVSLLRGILIIVPYLYIFSNVAVHEMLPITDEAQAAVNPLYNPNMWIILWTQSSATITSNLITMIWTIVFLYTGIYKDKVIFKNWKINKYIAKKYIQRIMNDSKIKVH